VTRQAGPSDATTLCRRGDGDWRELLSSLGKVNVCVMGLLRWRRDCRAALWRHLLPTGTLTTICCLPASTDSQWLQGISCSARREILLRNFVTAQPLTEMSNRSRQIMFLGSRARPEHRADDAAAICEPVVWTLWDPQHLTTLWTSTACYGLGVTFVYSAHPSRGVYYSDKNSSSL
jgi:hypothetical protein